MDVHHHPTTISLRTNSLRTQMIVTKGEKYVGLPYINVEQSISTKTDQKSTKKATSTSAIEENKSVNSGVVVEQVVKDEWINEKISENRDQISDSDLSTGAQIYDSLDTGYSTMQYQKT